MSVKQTVSLLDDDFVALLADTYYAVEANSFEYSALYKEYAKEQGHVWKENLSGRGACIGYVGKRMVFVSFRTAIINGRKILFYEATSPMVDWDMIEDWLRSNLPTSAKRAAGDLRKADANNFYSALYDN